MIVIENLDRNTSLMKTKSEVLYDIILNTTSTNTPLDTNMVIKNSVSLYQSMVNCGIIKEL